MKKISLFLLFLMALMVMSCSKDETSMSISQERAIEFATYVGRDAQTRASVTDLAALQAADVGFGVFAYYTAQDDYANNTTKPNFMYNQQVKYAGAKWGYEPLKYWPNNTGDKVSFFAYGPYSSIANSNISDFSPLKNGTGDPTLKLLVPSTVKDQTDLVWGVNETGGLPFLNQTKQTVGADIKFIFKHALARIGFNVEAMVDLVNTNGTGTSDNGTTDNGDIATNTKIVVTQVQLIGKFYETGVLNLNNTTDATPNWNATLPSPVTDRTFTLNQTNGNFLSSHNDATNISTAGQLVTNAKAALNAADSYIMVIPQDLTTDKVKIVVTYDVITKDTSLAGDESKITNTIASNEFAFNFEHGKAYTFNLHLGMTSVKFDASVTDWADETGTVVNVPINTTTP